MKKFLIYLLSFVLILGVIPIENFYADGEVFVKLSKSEGYSLVIQSSEYSSDTIATMYDEDTEYSSFVDLNYENKLNLYFYVPVSDIKNVLLFEKEYNFNNIPERDLNVNLDELLLQNYFSNNQGYKENYRKIFLYPDEMQQGHKWAFRLTKRGEAVLDDKSNVIWEVTDSHVNIVGEQPQYVQQHISQLIECGEYTMHLYEINRVTGEEFYYKSLDFDLSQNNLVTDLSELINREIVYKPFSNDNLYSPSYKGKITVTANSGLGVSVVIKDSSNKILERFDLTDTLKYTGPTDITEESNYLWFDTYKIEAFTEYLKANTKEKDIVKTYSATLSSSDPNYVIEDLNSAITIDKRLEFSNGKTQIIIPLIDSIYQTHYELTSPSNESIIFDTSEIEGIGKNRTRTIDYRNDYTLNVYAYLQDGSSELIKTYNLSGKVNNGSATILQDIANEINSIDFNAPKYAKKEDNKVNLHILKRDATSKYKYVKDLTFYIKEGNIWDNGDYVLNESGAPIEINFNGMLPDDSYIEYTDTSNTGTLQGNENNITNSGGFVISGLKYGYTYSLVPKNRDKDKVLYTDDSFIIDHGGTLSINEPAFVKPTFTFNSNNQNVVLHNTFIERPSVGDKFTFMEYDVDSNILKVKIKDISMFLSDYVQGFDYGDESVENPNIHDIQDGTKFFALEANWYIGELKGDMPTSEDGNIKLKDYMQIFKNEEYMPTYPIKRYILGKNKNNKNTDREIELNIQLGPNNKFKEKYIANGNRLPDNFVLGLTMTYPTLVNDGGNFSLMTKLLKVEGSSDSGDPSVPKDTPKDPKEKDDTGKGDGVNTEYTPYDPNPKNEDKTPRGEIKKIPKPTLNKVDHIAYIKGYPNNTIRPSSLLTREEAAMIFYRLLDKEYRAYLDSIAVNIFPDMPDDTVWSVPAISALTRGSILHGYPDNSFRPRNPITRAEVAKIATMFDKLELGRVSIFSDIEDHWAKSFIISASKKGWIHGYPDNTFRPQEYITREEFVSLVNNMLDRRVEESGLLDNRITFKDLNDKTSWSYYPLTSASNSYEYKNYIKDGKVYQKWLKMLNN